MRMQEISPAYIFFIQTTLEDAVIFQMQAMPSIQKLAAGILEKSSLSIVSIRHMNVSY